MVKAKVLPGELVNLLEETVGATRKEHRRAMGRTLGTGALPKAMEKDQAMEEKVLILRSLQMSHLPALHDGSIPRQAQKQSGGVWGAARTTGIHRRPAAGTATGRGMDLLHPTSYRSR